MGPGIAVDQASLGCEPRRSSWAESFSVWCGPALCAGHHRRPQANVKPHNRRQILDLRPAQMMVKPEARDSLAKDHRLRVEALAWCRCLVAPQSSGDLQGQEFNGS